MDYFTHWREISELTERAHSPPQHCLSLVTLALGRPLEAVHNEFGIARRIILPDRLG